MGITGIGANRSFSAPAGPSIADQTQQMTELRESFMSVLEDFGVGHGIGFPRGGAHDLVKVIVYVDPAQDSPEFRERLLSEIEAVSPGASQHVEIEAVRFEPQ
jgi:hypothetical protein